MSRRAKHAVTPGLFVATCDVIRKLVPEQIIILHIKDNKTEINSRGIILYSN